MELASYKPSINDRQLSARSGRSLSKKFRAIQFAFGLELISRPDTAQLVIDLYLMAALAGIWMAKDNRARGGSLIDLLPYLILTAVFVSVGPLLYLVVKGFNRERQA